MIAKDRSFEMVIERGYFRGNVEFADNYRTTHVPDMLGGLFFGCFQLYIAFQCAVFGPYFFKGKAVFKVQQAVVMLEFLPNLQLSFANMLFGTWGWVPWCKFAMLGTWPVNFTNYHFFFRPWATLSTLFMAIMWMNEVGAMKAMRSATPILKSKPKLIVAATLFCGLIDFFLFYNYDLARGAPNEFIVTPDLFLYFVLPMISFACSTFFQTQAGKIASSLSNAGSSNRAMVEFRQKLMRNLARGGLFDIASFVLVPFLAGSGILYGHGRGISGLCSILDWIFRTPVSFFQVVSIEPPEIARKKQQAFQKVGSVSSSVRSSFSSTASSSMSSTASSSSSAADSSSTDSGSSTATATTVA
jgi:hypothetical protein